MRNSTIGMIVGTACFVITGLGIHFTSPEYWFLPEIIAIPIMLITFLSFVWGCLIFGKAISDALHGN